MRKLKKKKAIQIAKRYLFYCTLNYAFFISDAGQTAHYGIEPKKLSRRELAGMMHGFVNESYGTTAQFVGSAGDAFSAICCLQTSRFTASKPSKSAIASDEKCIRHRTNSFVRYCLKEEENVKIEHERHNSCRWCRHPIVPAYDGNIETAFAGI